jgi:FAD/FMN-containing dehydrogenase
LVSLTRSSSPEPNWRARVAAVLGFLAAAAVPLAVALAARLDEVDLVDVGVAAVPFAAVAGLAAFTLGTRARRRSEFTLGRVGGFAAGTAGRWLGAVGLYLAATAALAVGVYGLLTLFA